MHMNKIGRVLKVVGYVLLSYSISKFNDVTHLCDECFIENWFALIRGKQTGVLGIFILLVAELLSLKK